MSFAGLACCLTLLAYGAVVTAGSPLVLPFLRPAARTFDPGTRARRLLALRLLPSAFALFVAGGLVLPAFVWLEPRTTDERVGPWLLLAAGLSGAVLVAGIARGAAAVLATRRLVRRWSHSARPIRLAGVTLPAFAIDERFPIVTLTGCVQPRLFVSRTVLARCTSAEFAAIVAHESGHLWRRDPWSRLLLRACPDILALTPLGAELEQRWAEAAEQAADDHAAAEGTARSLDLASALLEVARLAGAARPRWLPMIALYRGGGVAQRAARLLEQRDPPTVVPRRRPGVLAAIALAAGVLFVPVAAELYILHALHRMLEALVLLLA